MALRICHNLCRPLLPPINLVGSFSRSRKFSVQGCAVDPTQSQKLVLEVKEMLETEHHILPVGKNGRDDDEMILWFLKDRRFSVEDAVAKLVKAIKWRQEFGVSELSEESIKHVAETGKAYVHDFLDVDERPVLVVVASKHFPGVHDPIEDEKLCAFLIEKALSKLPPGKQAILGIIDLRGFSNENADLKFLSFLFDVFYYYYPKRLGQVLFVEAPLIFNPIWQLTKPLLKSYASLSRHIEVMSGKVMLAFLDALTMGRVSQVRFCSVETVRNKYFTEKTLPETFRD